MQKFDQDFALRYRFTGVPDLDIFIRLLIHHRDAIKPDKTSRRMCRRILFGCRRYKHIVRSLRWRL